MTIEAAVSVLRVQPGDVVKVFVAETQWLPPEEMQKLCEGIRGTFPDNKVIITGSMDKSDMCEFIIQRGGKDLPPEPSIVVEVPK